MNTSSSNEISNWIAQHAKESAKENNLQKLSAKATKPSQAPSVSAKPNKRPANTKVKIRNSRNPRQHVDKPRFAHKAKPHLRRRRPVYPKFPRRVNSAYKRAKRYQCYRESEPVSDDTLGPLINCVTAHIIRSRYGNIVKYQHIMNPRLAQPRISKDFLKYLNWLWRRQFRLSANDIKQMSQLMDIKILALTSASIPVRVKRVIADSGSTRYNHLLQKIEKQIENDAHSRTTEEALSALADNASNLNKRLYRMIEIHKHQNAKMHRLLLGVGALLTDLYIKQAGGASAMDVKNLRVKLSSDTVLNAIRKEINAGDDLISNYQHRYSNTGRESKNLRRRNRR